MSTFVDQQEYVVINCGHAEHGGAFLFAMTREHYNWTRRGNGWFCPMGHSRIWTGKTDEQKLQEAEARETALRDQLGAAVRDAETVRHALVRDRHRFANGVCPCCNRSFENVRRHMAGEHPDYDLTHVAGDLGTAPFECSCGAEFDTYRGLRIHQGQRRPDDWEKRSQSPRSWEQSGAHTTVV